MALQDFDQILTRIQSKEPSRFSRPAKRAPKDQEDPASTRKFAKNIYKLSLHSAVKTMAKDMSRPKDNTLQKTRRRLLNLAHMPARIFQLVGLINEVDRRVNGIGQQLDTQGHQLGQLVGQFDDLLKSMRAEVFLTNEQPEVHRRRIIAETIADHPDAAKAYRLILNAIERISDARLREHVHLHEVRYLTTYLMTPPGPGRLLDVAASDIYAAPLSQLKAWTIEPIKILEFDYETDRYPFADGAMDGVLLCEVIEHFVADPMHCLIELNRVLRSGGFIILTTPNVASWFSVYEILRQRHPSRWPVYAGDAPNKKNHIHAREYVVSEIVQLLEAAGFGDITVTTKDTGTAPPYRPIPRFDITNRGETIFCRAYKRRLPVKRFVTPIYLEDRDYEPTNR